MDVSEKQDFTGHVLCARYLHVLDLIFSIQRCIPGPFYREKVEAWKGMGAYPGFCGKYLKNKQRECYVSTPRLTFCLSLSHLSDGGLSGTMTDWCGR